MPPLNRDKSVRDLLATPQGQHWLDLVRRERPYRIPKGYLSWTRLSAIVAGMLDMLQTRPQNIDQASLLNLHRTALWFLKDAPLYCVRIELLRELQQTDLDVKPTLLRDLQPPLSTICFLLPENSMRSPEGGVIDYLVVHVADVGSRAESEASGFGLKLAYLPHAYSRNYHFSLIDTAQTVWFSGWGLGEDGSVKLQDGDVGGTSAKAIDVAWLAEVRNLVLQLLLVLQFEPGELESAPVVQAARLRSPARPRQGGLAIRTPRMLGVQAQRQSSQKLGGHHSSPRAHERRSHWRRLDPSANARWKEARWVRVSRSAVNRG